MCLHYVYFFPPNFLCAAFFNGIQQQRRDLGPGPGGGPARLPARHLRRVAGDRDPDRSTGQ